LGVRRIFVRIYSNLPEKFDSQKWLGLFLETTQKYDLHVYYGEEKSRIKTYFDSQSHSSHTENKGVEISVPKFCGIFFRIFRDFSRIFDKRKLLGVRLYPPASLASRSSIEAPSLLFMVLNTGTQQTRSKLACSTPVKKSKNYQITLELQTPNACYILPFFYAH